MLPQFVALGGGGADKRLGKYETAPSQVEKQYGRGAMHRKVRVTGPVRAGCWKYSKTFLGVGLSVFVLDSNGKALMPCTEKRVRLMLARGRARVHRVLHFVIRLMDVRAQDCQIQPTEPHRRHRGLCPLHFVLGACVGSQPIAGALCMQAMNTSDIEGVEYQQSTLAGYEVREYLLEKLGQTKGGFNTQTQAGVVQVISHWHGTLVQGGEGCRYQQYQHKQSIEKDAGRGRVWHDALCLPGMNARVSRAIPG
jgi:hypothetical protein